MEIYLYLDEFEPAIYEVNRVSYQLDEDGKPIDIFIYTSEETCRSIAEVCFFGCNMQPNEIDWRHPEDADEWVILCARLPFFQVVGAKRVEYN